MKYSIAVIPPVGPADVLADTIIDGLVQLTTQKNGENGADSYEFSLALPADFPYASPLDLRPFTLGKEAFASFCATADVIFFINGKKETNFKLAEKIGLWQKTVFVDGSEVGGNRRFDFNVQRDVLRGAYGTHGKVNAEMLERCVLYFKREKPYINSIIPLPFGIESRYTKYYSPSVVKDIDFFCVFGQDEYPLMRRYAKELVERFCKKHHFTYQIETTKGFSFDPNKKDGRQEFYQKLARSKVGISIGGGGFDTARFWEILGNNCLLITERIDIYEPDGNRLNYQRIFQCNNLYDIEYYLYKVGEILRTTYSHEKLEQEYQHIIEDHSSKARVLEIVSELQKLKV